MRYRCAFVFAVVALAASLASAAEKKTVAVYFSPKGGCEAAIIKELDAAQESVYVMAYSFTNAKIARALAKANARGVTVEAILDKSNQSSRYSSATFMHNAGILVYIDHEHAIFHHKVIVIDRRVVITGSFNFSRAAEERNAENLLVLRGYTKTAEKYLDNFRHHLSHSKKYERPAKPAASAPPVVPSRRVVAPTPVERRTKPRRRAVKDDAEDADDGGGRTVYVTKSGKKYHRAGCRYLRKSSRAMSVSEAKRRGYSPCKVCKP